mmetsp:Transcript_29841/g.84106  ORF Transcript_29841/g.84106 Transcript_29841/m.84106 type:complete len:237 (+) Transcript_29841:716-1426(+)
MHGFPPSPDSSRKLPSHLPTRSPPRSHPRGAHRTGGCATLPPPSDAWQQRVVFRRDLSSAALPPTPPGRSDERYSPASWGGPCLQEDLCTAVPPTARGWRGVLRCGQGCCRRRRGAQRLHLRSTRVAAISFRLQAWWRAVQPLAARAPRPPGCTSRHSFTTARSSFFRSPSWIRRITEASLSLGLGLRSLEVLLFRFFVRLVRLSLLLDSFLLRFSPMISPAAEAPLPSGTGRSAD